MKTIEDLARVEIPTEAELDIALKPLGVLIGIIMIGTENQQLLDAGGQFFMSFVEFKAALRNLSEEN